MRSPAIWSGLQNASSIAQLAGVDAFVLITAIVRAAQTARRNKKTCRELAEQVERIGGLLRSLEEHPGMGIMRRSETSAPLVELHETLRRACAVVESCRRGGYVRGLYASGSRATSLRDLQGRIAFFLQLFPIISHLDSTRLLVQVIDSAAARAPTSGREAREGLQRVQNFSFSQLMNATNSFSFENQTEQGLLATLYKGQLHGNDVTIKSFQLFLVRGNSGFIAPEYMTKGTFSVKTDVYSFGVMAFNRTPYGAKLGSAEVPLILSEEENAVTAEGDEEVRSGGAAVVLCIQEKPKRRPEMLEVTRMLSPRNARVPFPRRPGYARESPIYAGDRSTTP
ncbi:G-type lectin S-receptor-like serine/threonine-protein kinase [Panicum miliaceum]|uniref:G-type lectin S-receptor-like serine/threonine-protein kinase n=1 Tax=Panicum miliaceum TaxID=4540 RepID=A0A3L6QRV7_PANMI|nr:G-type lectin S-receptor-like serine/threonine-protein kinase [Panicum miliaceum]